MARFKLILSAAVLLCALLAGILFSVSTGGRSDVGLTEILFGTDTANTDLVQTVFRDIRLPRTAVACLLGVNLGLAGLILQAVTRNALASPAILGINQGAAFGLCLSLVFAIPRVPPEMLAMMGAAVAGACTLTISGALKGRIDSIRLVLGGVAVGAFAYGLVRFTYTLDDDLSRVVIRWTIGDIRDIRWPAAQRLALWTVPGFCIAWILSQRFNLLALGQDAAQGIGLNPRRTLLMGTLLAAGLAGVSVSVAGPIAFAGLVVPHMARFLFGTDYKVLVPCTAAMGGALLLVADGMSKSITPTGEAPIGVVVALIGAPWFLWQVLRTKDLI